MKKTIIPLFVLAFCASTLLSCQTPSDSLKIAKGKQMGTIQPTDSLALTDTLGRDSLLAEAEVVRRERVSEIKMEPINGKTGTVVLNVCITGAGDVTVASFTQRGSTTTDRELINAATGNVKKMKFTESDQPMQCGAIAIQFKTP